MEKVCLFVYGTLKRGEPLHYLLEGARFLGEGHVRGYALYHLGEYPAVRPASETSLVWGEVYEIPSELLPVLDEVEDEYQRQKVRVKMKGRDGFLQAWIYVYRDPLPEHLRIPEGRWVSSP